MRPCDNGIRGVAVVGWTVAGLGMGIGYAPLSVVVLGAAAADEAGAASAGLILSDTLGVAVGTATGGWLVALADGRAWPVSTGVAWVFVVALVVGLGGVVAANRLPDRVPHAAPGG